MNNYPKKPAIYKLVNTLNDKCYIGCTMNLKNRIRKHFYELKNNTHHNQYLQRSFNKDGKNVFEVEVIKVFKLIGREDLIEIEKEYIKSHGCLENGYNLMLDGRSHFSKMNKSKKHIKSNRKKQCISVMAFDRFTGKLSYTFDCVSDAARFFNDQSTNISKCCKGRANYIKGHVFIYAKDYDENKCYKHLKTIIVRTSKDILNYRKAQQKRLGRPVYKYDLDFNLIEEYPARAEAERQHNMKKEQLRSKIDKKTPFKGYYWKHIKI